MSAELAAISQSLSGLRSALWALNSLWWLLKFARPAEPPIFGDWRFYDDEPGPGNAVGVATLKRVGPSRKVKMIGLRTKASTAGTDTEHLYRYKGFLRDRKLVLTWVAEDRPDTFGTMVLALNEACDEMTGFTTFVPFRTGRVVSRSIHFRRK